MNIFSFLVVGVIVSWLANLVVIEVGFGRLSTLMVGVFGAVVGGFIFEIFGYYPYSYWDSVETSLIGAVVVLAVVRLLRGSPKLKNQIV